MAVVGGGSRRVNETSPDSTFGTGQNTCRDTDPARRTAAHQAAFTDGTPYAGSPGPGRQPLGDLGLHHDQARRAGAGTAPAR